jgi:hypothetical protein
MAGKHEAAKNVGIGDISEALSPVSFSRCCNLV